MPPMKDVELSQVRVVDVGAAPLGSVLQLVLPSGGTGIVMRSQLTAANGLVEGVVLLEGASAGDFYGVVALGGVPALDISSLIRLALDAPGPVSSGKMGGARLVGQTVEISASSGPAYLAVGVKLPQTTSLQGYLRLQGGNAGVIGEDHRVGRTRATGLTGHTRTVSET
jgi:hypothetical protein